MGKAILIAAVLVLVAGGNGIAGDNGSGIPTPPAPAAPAPPVPANGFVLRCTGALTTVHHPKDAAASKLEGRLDLTLVFDKSGKGGGVFGIGPVALPITHVDKDGLSFAASRKFDDGLDQSIHGSIDKTGTVHAEQNLLSPNGDLILQNWDLRCNPSTPCLLSSPCWPKGRGMEYKVLRNGGRRT
jgi:hypothetical protein